MGIRSAARDFHVSKLVSTDRQVALHSESTFHSTPVTGRPRPAQSAHLVSTTRRRPQAALPLAPLRRAPRRPPARRHSTTANSVRQIGYVCARVGSRFGGGHRVPRGRRRRHPQRATTKARGSTLAERDAGDAGESIEWCAYYNDDMLMLRVCQARDLLPGCYCSVCRRRSRVTADSPHR